MPRCCPSGSSTAGECIGLPDLIRHTGLHTLASSALDKVAMYMLIMQLGRGGGKHGIISNSSSCLIKKSTFFKKKKRLECVVFIFFLLLLSWLHDLKVCASDRDDNMGNIVRTMWNRRKGVCLMTGSCWNMNSVPSSPALCVLQMCWKAACIAQLHCFDSLSIQEL